MGLLRKMVLGGDDPLKRPIVAPKPSDEEAMAIHRLRVRRENIGRTLTMAFMLRAKRAAPVGSGRSGQPASVAIIAAPGEEGACALAAARHLLQYGLDPAIAVAGERDAAGQGVNEGLECLEAIGAAITALHNAKAAERFAGSLRPGAELWIGAPPPEAGGKNETVAEAARAVACGRGLMTIRVEAGGEFRCPAPSSEDFVFRPDAEPMTRERSRAVDSIAQETYRIPGTCLMENAGYWTAREAFFMRAEAASSGRAEGGSGRVAVVCGRGNNGGDGLVAARMLAWWEVPVEVFLLGTAGALSDDPARNAVLAVEAGVPIREMPDAGALPILEAALRERPLIVDAILGTGMTGEVRGLARDAVAMLLDARRAGAPVLAVDCPSGMDCNTGEPLGICVEADATVTFGAPKTGFLTEAGRSRCGRVVVADICLPRRLWTTDGQASAGESSGDPPGGGRT
ncbi:MAG: NAD(P)H-hydrate epimerase [Planctomycetota bacterium]|nr:NAD(P)H-hydrate epimerase [Planctomycetota bacterium]